MFPIINHIDDLKMHVADMPEIRFTTNKQGFTIACYVISGAGTFTGENKQWARECRGITFYPNGEICSRPFHKFFNIGELPETLSHNIDWQNISRIMDKRDGSMVHPININGKIILKTKKSFDSDVALEATKLLNTKKFSEVYHFCKKCTELGITPIYEYTAPTNQIVLSYANDDLQLLHIRVNRTGEYINNPKQFAESLGFDISCVFEYNTEQFGETELFNSMENDQDKEGYVLTFKDGSFVKGKTEWYLQLHRAIVFVRERDIAKMVIDENIDDYKSYLVLGGKPIDAVNQIEQQVLEHIRKLESDIDAVVDTVRHLTDRKTVAAMIKGHQLFSAAMTVWGGQEYDVKKHFVKHMLRENFSLKQV